MKHRILKYIKYLSLLIILPSIYYLTIHLGSYFALKYVYSDKLDIIDEYYDDHLLECSFDSTLEELNYNCLYNAEVLSWKKFYFPNGLDVSKFLCDKGLDYACKNYDYLTGNYTIARRPILVTEKQKSISLCFTPEYNTFYTCGVTENFSMINSANDLYIYSAQSNCYWNQDYKKCSKLADQNYILSNVDLVKIYLKNSCDKLTERSTGFEMNEYCKKISRQFNLSSFFLKTILSKKELPDKKIYAISQSKPCLDAEQGYCFKVIQNPRRLLENIISEKKESKIDWDMFNNVGLDFYSAMLISQYNKNNLRADSKSVNLNYFNYLYNNQTEKLEAGCKNGTFKNCGRIYDYGKNAANKLDNLRIFCKKGDFESCQFVKLINNREFLNLTNSPLYLNHGDSLTAFQFLYFKSNAFFLSKTFQDKNEGVVNLLSFVTIIIFITILILFYYSSKIFDYIKNKIIEDKLEKIKNKSQNGTSKD